MGSYMAYDYVYEKSFLTPSSLFHLIHLDLPLHAHIQISFSTLLQHLINQSHQWDIYFKLEY